MKLSYTNYRSAVHDAFSSKMSSPTIFWSVSDGFYVATSPKLSPNGDVCLGLAYYSLNDGGRPSFSGSRGEYDKISRAINLYHSPDFAKKVLWFEYGECEYQKDWETPPCSGLLHEHTMGTCDLCGQPREKYKCEKTITLNDVLNDPELYS